MTALLRYDAARQALAEAIAFDDVKTLADKAEAMRIYAKQAGDTEMEQNATELRLRAVQKFGRMETELHAAGLMHSGGRPSKTGDASEPVLLRVAEVRRLLTILERSQKSHPLLVGEAGVGKGAVVRALAQRVEVDAKASYHGLEKRTASHTSGAKAAGFGVPSSVPKWHATADEDGHYCFAAVL